MAITAQIIRAELYPLTGKKGDSFVKSIQVAYQYLISKAMAQNLNTIKADREKIISLNEHMVTIFKQTQI